jgi:hypothetical protein
MIMFNFPDRRGETRAMPASGPAKAKEPRLDDFREEPAPTITEPTATIPNVGRRERILLYFAISIICVVFVRPGPFVLLLGLTALVICIILSVKWWIADLS